MNPDLLTRRGLVSRLVSTGIGLLLLLTGTVIGSDDDFPFGPFRMFATTNRWDEPISAARAEILDDTGARIMLTERNSGVRRAELEGQLGRFRDEPARLADLARAYRAHNPRAPRPVEVTVLWRHHEIGYRGPTGRWRDEVVATWRP